MSVRAVEVEVISFQIGPTCQCLAVRKVQRTVSKPGLYTLYSRQSGYLAVRRRVCCTSELIARIFLRKLFALLYVNCDHPLRQVDWYWIGMLLTQSSFDWWLSKNSVHWSNVPTWILYLGQLFLMPVVSFIINIDCVWSALHLYISWELYESNGIGFCHPNTNSTVFSGVFQ